jgi:hypothetical protein
MLLLLGYYYCFLVNLDTVFLGHKYNDPNQHMFRNGDYIYADFQNTQLLGTREIYKFSPSFFPPK